MSKSSRVLLLTTTSIVSILVASHGANAAGQLYTNPLNSTLPYIHVESSTVDEGDGSRSLTVDAVVNDGAVSNTDGRSGIKADSENLTKITNSSTGTIDVTDESTTDSGRGRASARGIRVESSDGNAPVVDNQGSISAAATAINYDNESSKKGSAKASARARGIDAEGANGVDGTIGISNSGSVTATANAGAYVGVAVPDINGPVTTPKKSRGNVDASAVGINVSDRNSSGINGISSTGTVDATATGSLNLAAYVSGGHHDAEAEASSGADVRATGIRVQHEVIDGVITTDGTVNATATTTNEGLTVTASHDDGDAKAVSGNGSSHHGHGSDAEYSTSATGVDISAGSVGGNVSSGADVNAVASSTGSENVSATASDDARAEASRLSEVNATGVRVDIGIISADDATSVANSGAITAGATSSDIATVTADAGDKARVKRNSETHVSAAGLLLNVDDQVDTLSNSGDITVTADINPAPVVTTDVVDIPEPFYTNTLSATGESAKVSAHTINSSDVIGAVLTADHAVEVSNSGDITVGSTSYVGTLATADGTEKAKIRIEEDNDVTARGLIVSVGDIRDTFSNSGSISATATATTVDNATATTTIPPSGRQDPVGVADIQIVDGSTSAVSSGLAVNTNQFGGSGGEVPGFSNSGSVSSTASASNTLTAVATGQEAASAVQNGSTGSVALGTQVGLDISGLFSASGNLSDLGGLIGDIGQVEIGSGYENSGAITADAQTTIDRTLTASALNARAGSNTDDVLQLDGYAISAGQIVVAGDVGGNFANSGAITATSGINHTDVFTANGENEAAAGAGYIGDDVSLALPLSVSLSLGSVLLTPHVDGDISNTADVSASSTVNTDQTFDATATDGDATAGAINLQAAVGAGLISIAQNVEGEFSNTANIDGTAVSTNTVTATATGSEHARVGAGNLNIALAFGAEVDSIGGVLNHLVGAASDILGLHLDSAPFATDGSSINGVSNTGAISASATATQTETFTATIGAADGDSSGNAEVQKYLGVNAAISSGLGVNYDTLQTGFSNTGAIQSDSTAATTANYTATNGRSSESQGASVDAGFSTTLAIASGLQLSAQQIFNGIVPLDIGAPITDVVSNSGDVTVNATATYDLTGTATADNGEAWVANTSTDQIPTVGAVASGINVTAGYVDGNVTNSGSVAVTAVASGTTNETVASGYSGSATSGTNVNASANGVLFSLDEVNGGVSNTGSISAAANADYTTNLTAPDSVDGFINLTSYAEGLGVYPIGESYPAIGGDLNVGSGDITASAHSAGTLNATTTAQSDGLSINARSMVRGAELVGGSIDGALLSDANIQTSAFSSATVTGPQTDTYSWSNAVAAGINAYWDEIGNGVDIGGTVDVTGTAVTDTTSGGAEAYASVGGINLSDFDNYLSVTGDINLSAAVSASAKADATGTGGLVSGDSDQNNFNTSAMTSGVYVSNLNLDGNFTNTGRVGILSEATSSSVLSVDATDLEFCGGAMARSIYTSAVSEGFTVDGEYISGNFLNSGVIGSGAISDANVTLSATGLDGQTLQQSTTGSVYSDALDVLVTEIDGSVTNTGYLSAYATNTNSLTIGSPDDSASAIYAEAVGGSHAVGFLVSFDNDSMGTVGGAISNSGSMLVKGTDSVMVDVQSDTVDGYASARSSSYAIGLSSVGEAVGGLNNSGQLDVISTSTATAAGTSQPIAKSYSRADGVLANWGLVNGDVSNSGALNISASATADAGTGFAGAHADAVGFNVLSHGINDAFDGPITTISGSILNTGAITVAANATATGSEIEPALINQMSDFYGTNASATGILLQDVTADGSLGNTGNINVTAVGTRTNGGEASTDAIGISVQTSSIASGITNSGVVNASATSGSAVAGGLVIASGAVVGNSVTNTGTLSATATGTSAQSGAAAYGVAVWGAAIDGSLNNSGTISAAATGPGAVGSAGILVSEGGSVTSINNTGQISAQNAIDLTSAGLGTAINQLNGTITGSIITSNENEDVINWSGGKIVGDISGDSLDTLNIFAGNSNLFIYNNNIDGLGAINIGNGGAQTGAYLAGNVTNTNSLNVNNGGVLYVGTSTSIGVENFNQSSGGSSVYNLNAVTNGNGLITATNVNLAGGVTAVLNDGIYRNTLSYHVIDLNEGGSLNGSYSSYSIQNALGEDVFFLDLTGQYDATGATLLVTKVPFASAPGLSDNGRTLSGALDQLYNQIDPNSPDGQLLSKLVLLTPAQYDDLANQAAGSVNTQSVGQTIQIMDSLGSNIQSQINEQRGGSVFASNDGGQTFKLMVADNQVSGVMNDAGSPYAVAAAKAGWDGSTISPNVPSKISVWTRVFGDWSNLNSSGGNAGYSSTGGGVLVGADYLVTPKAVVGLAGGYQNNNLNFSDGAGSGSVKSWSLTAYGDYDFGKLYVSGLAGYAWQTYTTDRFIYVPSVLAANAHSVRDGDSISASAETGYTVDLPAAVTLQPYLGLAYTYASTDGAQETGAGLFNLSISDADQNSLRSTLGLRVSKPLQFDSGMKFTPSLELGWRHEFLDTNAQLNQALTAAPGATFSVNGTSVSRDSAVVGGGVAVNIAKAVDVSLEYRGQFNSDYQDNLGGLKVRVKF